MTSYSMQAAVLQRYGAPENIKISTIPRPQPKAKEILVKVYATTVTTADTMMRKAQPAISRLFLGFSRPRNNIMGTGFAGKIVALGAEVEDYEIGDRVFGESGLGFAANAEYLCVASEGVMDLIPPTCSYAEAATLTDGPLTSYNFLRKLGQIQAGQSVLIIGASGSLGTAAVQLARHFGAQVSAVCSSRNLALVRSLGAHTVIDYTTTDFTQSTARYDLIYDTIGVSSYSRCRHLLTDTGSYLTPVLGFSVLWSMLSTRLFSRRRAKFDATGLRPPQVLRQYLEEIVSLIEKRKLSVIIDKEYPLAEVVEAHRYVDTGRKRGNVVLLTA
ncbi:MAG: NAD(P)-dependent alcohol dehydrogenase [Bacteroidetes bacterium]|nr:MAG: NAD(P)-dependent alcohol dehydrogenase [Bacteroidota bacterium]